MILLISFSISIHVLVLEINIYQQNFTQTQITIYQC